MGVRKRFIVLPFLAALLALLAACLPQPDEPVEWVRRPESIVIQVMALHDPASELEQRVVVPEFTLYGYGALIFTRPDAEGRPRLLQAELPGDAIRDLLEFIVDDGFLDFFYDQPSPASGADLPATFIYVNTIGGANSVRTVGLGAVPLEESGEEFDDLRRLEEIVRRLNNLDPEAVGGEIEGEFSPETLLLHLTRMGEPPYEFTPTFLPPSEIDLAKIVPAGSAPVEHRVEGALAGEILRWLNRLTDRPEPNPWSVFLEQGDGTYIVTFAPVLPFEENFPEFDR